MLIGAALYKLGILQGARSRGFYLRMTLIAYAVAVPLRIVGAIEGANGVILLGWSTAFFVAMVARITIVEREFTERPATPRPAADPYKPQ